MHNCPRPRLFELSISLYTISLSHLLNILFIIFTNRAFLLFKTRARLTPFIYPIRSAYLGPVGQTPLFDYVRIQPKTGRFKYTDEPLYYDHLFNMA